jgi:hypothetical protein
MQKKCQNIFPACILKRFIEIVILSWQVEDVLKVPKG